MASSSALPSWYSSAARPTASRTQRAVVGARSWSALGKCWRLAVDYERKPEHHQAWVQWAMVRVMVKRLARQAPPLPARTLSLVA